MMPNCLCSPNSAKEFKKETHALTLSKTTNAPQGMEPYSAQNKLILEKQSSWKFIFEVLYLTPVILALLVCRILNNKFRFKGLRLKERETHKCLLGAHSNITREEAQS